MGGTIEIIIRSCPMLTDETLRAIQQNVHAAAAAADPEQSVTIQCDIGDQVRFELTQRTDRN